VVGGLLGSGKSSFAFEALRAAWLGGVFGWSFDLNKVERQQGASGVRRGLYAELDELAKLLGLPRRKLLQLPFVLLVDEMHSAQLHPAPHATLRLVEQLGRRSGRALIVPLHEDEWSDTVRRALALPTVALPALTPYGIHQMFRAYATHFGVAFPPEAVAEAASQALTPYEIVSSVERALQPAIRGAKPDELVLHQSALHLADAYLALEGKLASAMLLETPYRPRNQRELVKLARWETYGLVTRAGEGYGLTETLFTRRVAEAIPEQAYERAAARNRTRPLQARRELHDALLRRLVNLYKAEAATKSQSHSENPHRR
jgi:hypothetical protein